VLFRARHKWTYLLTVSNTEYSFGNIQLWFIGDDARYSAVAKRLVFQVKWLNTVFLSLSFIYLFVCFCLPVCLAVYVTYQLYINFIWPTGNATIKDRLTNSDRETKLFTITKQWPVNDAYTFTQYYKPVLLLCYCYKVL